jgi:ABC-2 type transport system ATP-binding protein
MVIMYEGKILAADTPENLQRLMSSNSQVLAEILAPFAELQECWASMPEIEHFDVAAAEGDYFRCALTPHNGVDLRARVFALARERGWSLRELTRNRHSLEDIYVQVTRPDEEEEG